MAAEVGDGDETFTQATPEVAPPMGSETFHRTEKVPAEAKVWWAIVPRPVPPSPNVHRTPIGPVPPESVRRNVSATATVTGVGSIERSPLGRGWTVTSTVAEAFRPRASRRFAEAR
ncbi:MAG TPA: hypothetical protein VGS18_02225 [Thermoplasmata archaeon]|nr:hypothetical protein [Thermoplasmata archaeon]